MGVATSFDEDTIYYAVDQLSNASIAITSDPREITDKNGNVVAVNRVGDEDGVPFWGTSFVCGPQGELYYEASTTDEESIIVDIDMRRSEQVRRWWPFLRDRRIEAYGDLTKRFRD